MNYEYKNIVERMMMVYLSEEQCKVLPVTKPIFTLYPYQENILAVISRNSEYLPWLYANFIQIEMPNNYGRGLRLDFSSPSLWKTCPWVYYQRINRDMVKLKWDSIISFLIDCIRLDNYAYFNVDRSCIKEYNKDNRGVHDIFVFGYDLENKTFDIADNFQEGVYSFKKTSFSEMEDAYHSVYDNGLCDWLEGIEMISYRPYGAYSFDVDILNNLLKDYLLSNNTPKKYLTPRQDEKRNWFFGLKCYEAIKQGLELALANDTFVDIRAFHCLWEHKKLMILRLKFLREHNYINESRYFIEEYKKLEERIYVLRSLILKYNIKKNAKLIQDVISEINEIPKTEAFLISNLINELEDCRKNKNVMIGFNKNRLYLSFSDGWYCNQFDMNASSDNNGYVTNTINSYVQYVFLGTELQYFATKDIQMGIAELYIDGIKMVEIDLYSPIKVQNEVVYSINNLTYQYHIIRVVNRGKKNEEALDSYISLCSFADNVEFEKSQSINNEVTFKSLDYETSGSWINYYGFDGYDIIGFEKQLPSYVNISYSSASDYTWLKSTNCIRALQKTFKKDRIAACKYHDSIEIDFVISCEESKKISIYLIDWDNLKRAIKIEAYDGDNGDIIDIQEITNFYNGVYINYDIKGHVKVHLTKLDNRTLDIVLSGIFIN